jgi:uncharacterized membrane protein
MTANFLLLMITPVTILKKFWGMSWITKLILLILAYLEPIKNLYHLAITAVILNFIVGWYKSRVVNKEAFRPDKAWHTIEKIGIFTIYIVVVYLFEQVILGTAEFYTTRILVGILILAELKSISENGDAIIGQRIFTGLYKAIKRVFDARYLNQDDPKAAETKES